MTKLTMWLAAAVAASVAAAYAQRAVEVKRPGLSWELVVPGEPEPGFPTRLRAFETGSGACVVVSDGGAVALAHYDVCRR